MEAATREVVTGAEATAAVTEVAKGVVEMEAEVMAGARAGARAGIEEVTVAVVKVAAQEEVAVEVVTEGSRAEAMRVAV